MKLVVRYLRAIFATHFALVGEVCLDNFVFN